MQVEASLVSLIPDLQTDAGGGREGRKRRSDLTPDTSPVSVCVRACVFLTHIQLWRH